MTALISGALVIALCSSGAPDGDGSEARRAIERAKVHVSAGEYDLASAALAEAYALDPRPALLYARAQAERFGGRCTNAVELYRAFLAEEPPPEDRALAERYVEECEAQLEATSSSDPEPDEGSLAEASASMNEDAPAIEDTPELAVRERKPWYADVPGGVLVGSGVVGLAVGLGLQGRAITLDRFAQRDASHQDEFVERMQQVVTLNRAGLATIGVGSALVLAGVIRYAIVGARARQARTSVAWSTPESGVRGGGLVLIHRF